MGAEKKDFVFKLLFCTMVIVLNLTATAQQWVPNFKHYGVRDGLPSSEVYQITSDAKKNLWFVTDRGVVRYDGYSFRVYDNKNSLPENSVIKVYKDWKNRIWFISYTGMLSYYENGKIIPYKYNSVIRANLGIPKLASMYADTHEKIFLNGIEGKIYTIDSSGHYSEIIMRTDTDTYFITDTASSLLTFYIQMLRPLTRLRVQSPDQTFDILVNEKIYYRYSNTIKLSNGDLIFYCGRTVIRIRPDRSSEIKHFKLPVLNVFEDDEKQLWVGCYQDGVYVYNASMTLSSHFFIDLSVTHIHADYEGGLWLSTLESGIFYLPSKNNLSFAVEGNILKEKINAIATFSDSVLLFAASKGMLYKFNTADYSLNKIDLKKNVRSTIESVSSLFPLESKRQLIVATENSASVFPEKFPVSNWQGLKLVPYYSTVRFTSQDDNHILGSEYYLAYSLDINTLSMTYIYKKDFHPTALFKDSKERLLAGGLNGLFIYNDSNFIPFDSTNKILQRRVTDIQQLDNNWLVIATRSDGIILYADSVAGTINSTNGLSSDNINRIIVEPNTIWASTNRGLNKIIITSYSPLMYSVQHYNISSGLSSDEINDFSVVNKNIYVATNEGLTLIKEDRHDNILQEMPLYVNSLKINDQDTTVLASYSLNHTQNTVNITFAAVSFKQSKNISYLYRLQGQDTTWRSTTNRDVQFTNLPPGKYKFQLLAQSSDNVFSLAPVEIDFDISPPFYNSIWFRLLAAFVFWLILFAVIHLRIESIKRKTEARHALNKKFSELNLNALRSQMNPHFTFNVLNSIQYYIAKKDSESAQMYITKFSRLIRMILDQSRTEFISLAEEIKMLTLYIELEELRFENKFTYTIEATKNLNTSGIFIPGMLIQPFVENSIRHGIRHKKGDAHVDINFMVSDSILICTIADNGIGRKEAAKLKTTIDEYKSVGTAIVDERIEALSILFDGKLRNYVSDLTDANGNAAGTCVTIEIPFKTHTP